MKTKKMACVLAVVLFAWCSIGLAAAQDKYPVKGKHGGGNATPAEAYAMVQKDPGNTFIIDIRTRYEYQDIGHPEGAYNIPLKFYTTKVGQKGYIMVANGNFCNDLKASFNPQTDTMLFLCRSAGRSVKAVNIAMGCGFAKSYNVLAGFEGDKIKDKANPDYGKRTLAGWRADGLPWTYHMDHKLMYKPDLATK